MPSSTIEGRAPMSSQAKPIMAFSLTGIQRALIAGLLLECLGFTLSAPAFFTAANLFEILRFSVELGLLAGVLTPVLITGGIDLSVGSTIGRVSALFGPVSHDFHVSVPISRGLGLCVGF